MLYVPPTNFDLLNFSNAAEIRVRDGTNWKLAGYVFAQGDATVVWEQWVYVNKTYTGCCLGILPPLSPTHDTPTAGDVKIRALQDMVASALGTKKTLLENILDTDSTGRSQYFLDNVLQLLKCDDGNVAEADLSYIVGKVQWQTPPTPPHLVEPTPASKRHFSLKQDGTLVAVLYQEKVTTTSYPHQGRYHQISTRQDCIPAPSQPLDYRARSGDWNLVEWYVKAQSLGNNLWYSVTDAMHFDKLMKFQNLPAYLQNQFPTAASNNTCS